MAAIELLNEGDDTLINEDGDTLLAEGGTISEPFKFSVSSGSRFRQISTDGGTRSASISTGRLGMEVSEF